MRVSEDPYRDSDPYREESRVWDFRPDAGWAPEFDLIGYHVEAIDGSLGRVSQSTHVTNGSFMLVDTGPWIFGRTVVIPAGIVTHIDHTGRRIYLECTKEQVKGSPDYSDEPGFRDKLANHYSGTPR
jgi:hypothetical protein